MMKKDTLDLLLNKKLNEITESDENPYKSEVVRIKKIIDETAHVKTYVIEPFDGTSASVFDFIPGQFAMWSLPGVGEAPFSYSGHGKDPEVKEIQFTIHKTGKITTAIFKLKEGDLINMRGPYGNGFPFEKMKDMDLIFVMGGIGAAPLRGVLHYVLENAQDYGHICVLHGARSPNEMLFKQEFFKLVEHDTVTCMLTVDSTTGDEGWAHNTGVVTKLFDQYETEHKDPMNTAALICGPPVMYKYVMQELITLGVPQDQIYITLERRMKCGVGKCGHCVIDYIYACVEGPVFTHWDAKSITEMI